MDITEDEMEKVRSPYFSQWLCKQKRATKFKWKDLANHLDISTQGVDNYAKGFSHPQCMKLYRLCEFIAIHTNKSTEVVWYEALKPIIKDYNHKTRKKT